MSRGNWLLLAIFGISVGLAALQTHQRVQALGKLTEEIKALRLATEETNVTLEKLERQQGKAPRFR